MKIFFCSLLIVLGASQSFAWNATGHMIVDDIALGRLTPKVKAEVQKLLADEPEDKANTFIDCGPWADDVRTKTTAPWHFIDQYFRADGKPTDLKPYPHNVVWAINHFSAILKDRTQSEANRAEALRYLAHFVGDIHQPLHCVSRITVDEPNGDKGGNLLFFSHPDGGRRPHELHYLWDDGGGLFVRIERPLDDAGRKQVDDLAKQALASLDLQNTRIDIKSDDPAAWAKEGLEIAKTTVYSTPEFQEPSPAYYKMAQEVSLQRVAIAGLRLADLLNKDLGN